MKDYTIKFREWSYAEELYKNFWEHLYCWCFGSWRKINTCDLWEDTGIRLLGIEINKRVNLSLTTKPLDEKEVEKFIRTFNGKSEHWRCPKCNEITNVSTPNSNLHTCEKCHKKYPACDLIYETLSKAICSHFSKEEIEPTIEFPELVHLFQNFTREDPTGTYYYIHGKDFIKLAQAISALYRKENV